MSNEVDLRKQRKVEADVTIDPAGLATEAKQDVQIVLETAIRDYLDTVETKLASIITNTTGLNLEATQIQVRDYIDTVETKLASIITNTTGLNLEVTQLLVKGVLDSIKAKTDNIDVTLSSRASESTLTQVLTEEIANGGKLDGINQNTLDTVAQLDVLLSTRASEATIATMLTLAGFQARINTLGQKTMANSTPVVISSDQTPLPVSTTPSASAIYKVIYNPANFSIDAGGSLRTSQATSYGDYKFLRDKLPLLFDFSGTGTNTFSTNLVALSVTSGQYVVGQSKIFHHYLAGRSQLIELTFDNFQAQANVTKRAGYFSSSTTAPFSATLDGIFMQSTGTTVSVEVIKAGTTIFSVAQASWDDPLNGSGASGLNVNWQNFNVIAFDFLYLGGTAVRFFIFYNGQWNLFHTLKYASTTTGTIIKTPNQPVRYEIVSTTGTGTFNAICSHVSTEGSINNLGLDRSVDSGVVGFTAAVVGTTYAIVGLRKGATFRDACVMLKSAQVFVNSVDQVRVDILLNPTVAGVFTYSAITNSSAESAIGVATNTVTGGARIYTGYNSQNVIAPISGESLLNYLGCTLLGVMDTIVLCVTPISLNATVMGEINFKEIA